MTPLPRAYAGDPFVVRTINAGPAIDQLHIDGHRFFLENRYRGPDGKVKATPTDTLHYGVSERFTAILDGGAGGRKQRAGDYLYENSVGRRARQGAWGMLRVLPRQVPDLQPLPGRSVPQGSFSLPDKTGGRPPSAGHAGNPCPSDAPERALTISAVDLPGDVAGRQAAFVPSEVAAEVKSGDRRPSRSWPTPRPATA